MAADGHLGMTALASARLSCLSFSLHSAIAKSLDGDDDDAILCCIHNVFL